MHKDIKAIYDEDKVLAEAGEIYGFTKDQAQFLADAENYVYEIIKENEPYILKITHTIRRTPEYILGEMDWLHHLAKEGLSVAKPISSLRENVVGEVPDGKGGAFLLRAYEKAPGHKAEESDWNGTLFYELGKYTGKMHRLTKSYRLSNPRFKRQEWDEEEQLKLRKYVPDDQHLVFERADALMEELRQLPKNPENYGLVHGDLHHGNFNWDNGKITTFDFDDIGYNWFVNDISILLYNILWYPVIPYEDKAAFTEEFMTHFMKGYREENDLDPSWLEKIPVFLRLRHMLIYGLLHQAFDLDSLGDEERRMLEGFRNDIEKQTPITEFNFSALV
ncbi:phosphotransferase enzyme family protein [Bacillus sp. ISL-51]|uniref:phosphotransferase enzyme family protein n=1 Tax=Bacteria TaxID=2 RepID=UPI001BEAB1EA|nr:MULTISPECIES: phosphotransferase enzyme family protein [Bacteria]MBT2572541.1 phosphotransferase enzyme family protein [Bacillus sp. ISL-51]MBT2634475.1 phosphotransferase enzyme family protein [Bacillus sp. ISL-26]MBT2711609.1 phosphotransferase enzyme family protein [Pseudomonas sp. ISL-88]